MKKITLKVSFLVAMFVAGISVYGQSVDKKILNWYNGKTPGMNTEAAYKLLKDRTPQTVVVGIIDSGVDIEHEDFKGQIWVNEDEIPGNGIDDDNNGYIDDVHGWNFLGTSNNENLEYTRIYKNGKSKFENVDATTLSAEEKAKYDYWVKAKEVLEAERQEAESSLEYYKMLRDQIIPMVPQMVKGILKKESYTLKDLKKWKPKEKEQQEIKNMAIAIETGELSKEDMDGAISHFEDKLAYHLNPDFDGRAEVGDDPNDFSQTVYGNNDVEGPDALHGTHVAGIVGALRGNGLGGDGVAAPVKLMSVRAIPNGDEYDKDVALAIRYCVDNGAMVINMSFGKAFSPNQKEVYEAMMYAESKGVLLVHAAGNDAKNLDKEPNFPAVKFDFQVVPFTHLLTIGASTRDAKGKLAANFSNYGQSVDIFAPGFEIYNAVPDNKYRKLQGTSMAAPTVAGMAALLKAYFPNLTMLEIKDIILKSGTQMGETMQKKPGSKDIVAFKTLTHTGSVVNLLQAVRTAIAMSAN